MGGGACRQVAREPRVGLERSEYKTGKLVDTAYLCPSTVWLLGVPSRKCFCGLVADTRLEGKAEGVCGGES